MTHYDRDAARLSSFSTVSTLLLTAGVVVTNAYMLARLAYDSLPAWWGYATGAAFLGLGYLAHIAYLLLDLASSTGVCPPLSSCKVHVQQTQNTRGEARGLRCLSMEKQGIRRYSNAG